MNGFAGILSSETGMRLLSRVYVYRAIIVAKSFTILRITREFNVSTLDTGYSAGTVYPVAYIVKLFLGILHLLRNFFLSCETRSFVTAKCTVLQ